MRSKLCQRHFTGNGAFDGVWRYDSQHQQATREALFMINEWIYGREQVPEYRDAVEGLVELYGDGVRHACRLLWAASLPQVREDEDKKLAYYDAGMDELTKYFRRHFGH